MEILNGTKIQIAKPFVIRKVILSERLDVSDKFRKHYQSWLDSFFGVEFKEAMEDGKVVHFTHLNVMMVNQATFDLLKAELEKQSKLNCNIQQTFRL